MPDLNRTPLFDLHIELGAKMVPFAGYELPVQYPLGVMKEHLHTRSAAGLFDVSHMGQVVVWPKSGKYEDAALALESLVPVNVLGLGEKRQRYAMFTNEAGGIEDDLMLANMGDHIFVVVNAACKEADIARMQTHLGESCRIEVLQYRALLALQGPAAEAALALLAPSVAEMAFMDVAEMTIAGAECVVSRSGYTGEDGYEISVANSNAVDLARALLAHPDVEPIGLGARDSLRLEAGLVPLRQRHRRHDQPHRSGVGPGQSRRRAARAVTERAASPVQIVFWTRWRTAHRAAASACCPKGRAPMREGTRIFVEARADDAGGVS